MSLPDTLYLRRGHIRAYCGLSDEEFDDLVAAGVLVPRYLPIPNAEKLPLWRRRRLPRRKRAVFLRTEVLAALGPGRGGAVKTNSP